MTSRTLVLTSLFALATLSTAFSVGCAAPSGAAADDEAIGETQDELSAAASKLAGKYYTGAPALGGFARLTLEADGTYTASIDESATCFTSPCIAAESGSWRAFAKKGGGVRLRVRPVGATARWYDAARAGATLTLVRAGTTEVLRALGADQCLDEADCDAGEECGPKMCLMYCLVSDPFCCGPSTCRPKTPPPCWGAWLDENGTCRTPADGVYPASCCAGPTCGSAQCAAGEVCCNPIAGICTPPGMACAQ